MNEIDILFVDKNDQPIGFGSRDEARANAISYRLSRVILRDENGRILSQQRSENKRHYPGLWTDSASGHVDKGEDYEQAAHREMFEEIGIKTDLVFLGNFSGTHEDHEVEWRVFSGVFEGHIHSSDELVLQQSEVQGSAWYDLDVLKNEMKENPSKFSPGFIKTISHFY